MANGPSRSPTAANPSPNSLFDRAAPGFPPSKCRTGTPNRDTPWHLRGQFEGASWGIRPLDGLPKPLRRVPVPCGTRSRIPHPSDARGKGCHGSLLEHAAERAFPPKPRTASAESSNRNPPSPSKNENPRKSRHKSRDRLRFADRNRFNGFLSNISEDSLAISTMRDSFRAPHSTCLINRNHHGSLCRRSPAPLVPYVRKPRSRAR